MYHKEVFNWQMRISIQCAGLGTFSPGHVYIGGSRCVRRVQTNRVSLRCKKLTKVCQYHAKSVHSVLFDSHSAILHSVVPEEYQTEALRRLLQLPQSGFAPCCLRMGRSLQHHTVKTALETVPLRSSLLAALIAPAPAVLALVPVVFALAQNFQQ